MGWPPRAHTLLLGLFSALGLGGELLLLGGLDARRLLGRELLLGDPRLLKGRLLLLLAFALALLLAALHVGRLLRLERAHARLLRVQLLDAALLLLGRTLVHT